MTTADSWLPGCFQGLEKLRCIGDGKYLACCPSHPDRTPSLSIRQGDKAWLVRCWVGCGLDEICAGLGIQKQELFYDHGLTREQRRTLPPQPKRRNWRQVSSDLQFASEGHWLRAEAIFHSAQKIELHGLTDHEVSLAWQCLEQAFHHQRVHERLDDAACEIRDRGLRDETRRHRERRSAA